MTTTKSKIFARNRDAHTTRKTKQAEKSAVKGERGLRHTILKTKENERTEGGTREKPVRRNHNAPFCI